MLKLSQYVANAATEYFAETGSFELNATWVAEYFQNAGVADDYPNQDLIVFYDMVQKELTLNAELARKFALRQLQRIAKAQSVPKQTRGDERR